MACENPLRGYRTNDGEVRIGGAQLLGTESPLAIACGKCLACRTNRAAQWAVRCLNEAELWSENSFLTLTYRTSSLPPGRTLDKRHWQLFAKKLRHRKGPFRFFACGEYGPKTLRPHYHALIFGHDWHQTRVLVDQDKNYYRDEELEKIWGHGEVFIAPLQTGAAAYVAQYTTKKQTDPEEKKNAYSRVDLATGEQWEVEPEFVLMSRNPGIGAWWYDRNHSDVFPSDKVIHAGKNYPTPDYYTHRYKNMDPNGYEEMKERRRVQAEKQAAKLTPSNIEARKYLARQRRDQKERKN